MEALRRVVSGSGGARGAPSSSSSGVRSARHRPSTSSSNLHKHEKLEENWSAVENPVEDGLVFFLKYLGNVIVDHPNGEGTTAAAVKKIVAMSNVKLGGGNGGGVGGGKITSLIGGGVVGGKKKKLVKMEVLVSPRGIRMTEVDSRTLFEEVSIYRVSFCTNDSTHSKVFAFIARNNDNESMECHAFLCPKKKTAQAITLSVSHSFNLAFETWEREKEAKKANVPVANAGPPSSASIDTTTTTPSSQVPSPAASTATFRTPLTTASAPLSPSVPLLPSPPTASLSITSPISAPSKNANSSASRVGDQKQKAPPFLLSAPPSKKQSSTSITSNAPVVSVSAALVSPSGQQHSRSNTSSSTTTSPTVAPVLLHSSSPTAMTPFGPAPCFPAPFVATPSSFGGSNVNPFLHNNNEDDDVDLEFESFATSRNNRNTKE